MDNKWSTWQHIFAWTQSSGLYVNMQIFGLQPEMFFPKSKISLIDAVSYSESDFSSVPISISNIIFIAGYHYHICPIQMAWRAHDLMDDHYASLNSESGNFRSVWHQVCRDELGRIGGKFTSIPDGLPVTSVFSDGFFRQFHAYLVHTSPNDADRLIGLRPDVFVSEAKSNPSGNNAKDVYFIQGCDTKRIKIGVSENVNQRLKGIQASEPLKLLAVIKAGGRQLEKELHKRFKKFCVHNEWFSPDPELLQYIEALP